MTITLAVLSMALAEAQAGAATLTVAPPEPPSAGPVLTVDPREPKAVAALALLAKDEPARVLEGIGAAQSLGLSLFAPPLGRILRSHPDAKVRVRAAQAIARLEWPADLEGMEARVRELAGAVIDNDTEVRHAVYLALASYPLPQAARLLPQKPTAEDGPAVAAARKALRDRDNVVRLGAVLAADPESVPAPPHLPTASAIAAVLTRPEAAATPALLSVVAAYPDAELVRPVLHYAGRRGGPPVQRQVLDTLAQRPLDDDMPVLAGFIGSADPAIAESAFKALASHKGPAATQALGAELLRLSRLHASTTGRKRELNQLIQAVGAALRDRDTAELAQALGPVLREAQDYPLDVSVFMARERRGPESVALRVLALAAAPSDEARDELLAEDAAARRAAVLPLLQEYFGRRRVAALAPLLAPLDEASTAALLDVLRRDDDPETLRAVARALAEVPDEKVVPTVERALTDAKVVARIKALYEVTAARQGADARRVLMRGIADQPEPEVVTHIFTALEETQEPELASVIMDRLAKTKDPGVVNTGLSAVRTSRDPALAPRLAALSRAFADEPAGERAYAHLLTLPAEAVAPELRRLAADEQLRKGLRLRAMRDLGEVGAPTDIPWLEKIAAKESGETRLAARQALHHLAPEQYGAYDSAGRWPLILSSAAAGGTLLALITDIAEQQDDRIGEQPEILLGGGGALIGASTAFLLTLDREVALGEAGYFATATLWGTLGGHAIGSTGVFGGTGAEAQWAAVGGELLGAALGGLTLGSSRFSQGDVVLTNFMAASWGVATVSTAGLLRLGGGDAGPGSAFSLGAAVAATPMLLFSPRLKVDADALVGMTLTAGFAAWLGGLAPHALYEEPEANDAYLGVGLGQAIGFTTGLLLAQSVDFNPKTYSWMAVGAVAGAAFGGGLGLSFQSLEGRPTYGLTEVGTLAGAATLALLGPRFEFRETDTALVLLMTAGGALSGSGTPERATEGAGADNIDTDTATRLRAGRPLLRGSLGFAAGLTASQLVDLSWGELAMTGFAGATVGFGAGGVVLLSGYLPDEAFSDVLAYGGAAAALATSLVAPRMAYEPADAALGVSTLSLGAFLGGFTPAYWTPEGEAFDDDEQVGGVLTGGALGLLFAGAVSQLTDVDAHRVLRVDIGAGLGMAMGGGLGLLVPSLERRETVALLQAGAIAGYAGASITERKSSYTPTDTFHLALVSGIGAAHGSMVPRLWRDPEDDVPDEEFAGGALVGMGVGGMVGRLAVRGHPGFGDVFEIGVFTGFGDLLGGGAWAIPGMTERERYQVLFGSGVLGLVGGELLAPHTEFSKNDLALVGLLAAEGAVGGALFFPGALGISYEKHAGAGAMLGAGAFGLAGLGLSQLVEYEAWPEAAFISGLAGLGFGVAGSVAPGGEKKVEPELEEHEQRSFHWAGVGLWADLALGLALGPLLDLNGDDVSLILSTAAVGAFAGYHVPAQLPNAENAEEKHRQRGALSGLALGALAGTWWSQGLEDSTDWALTGAMVSASTTLSAAGLTQLAGLSGGSRSLALQLSAATSFGVGSYIASHIDTTVESVGAAATFGAIGSLWGGLAPYAAGDDSEASRDAGILAGSGAGLLAGQALGQLGFFSLDDDVELLTLTSLGSLTGWAAVATAALSPTAQARGALAGSAVGVGVGALWARHTTYELEDLPLWVAGTAWGAWFGGHFGAMLETGHYLHDQQRRGGATGLGAGVGLATALAASQVVEVETADLVETTLWLGAGNLTGLGAAVLAGAEDPALRGLVQAGGLLGLGAGLWGSSATTYDTSDGLFAGTTMGLGALHGSFIAAYGGDDEKRGGGAALGAGLGLASGMLAAQRLTLEGDDIMEVILTTFAGDAIGTGLAMWNGASDDMTLAAAGLGGVTTLTMGSLVAQSTAFSTSDRLLTVYGMSLGAVMGGVAPQLWHGDDTDAGGGVLLGLGSGALVGGAASQVFDYEAGDVVEIVLGTSLSATAGAGLGLLVSDDPRGWALGLDGFGLAGAIAFGATVEHTQFEKGDAAVGTLAALYGVYQGAGMSLLVDGSERQVQGAIMLAGAGGALLGSYLGKYVQLDSTEILMLAAGSAWGLWVGGWGAAAIHDGLDSSKNPIALGVGTTALATDVALVATSIAISELVEMPPQRFAFISLAGGLGIVAGSGAAAMSGSDLKAGLVLGTVAGLVTGTVVTGFFDFAPRRTRPELPSADGAGVSTWLPQIEVVVPSVQVLPTEDPRLEGSPAMVFSLVGQYR